MRHLMVDLETLDTRPSTVILSIGAVVFDPEDAPTLQSRLYERCQWQSQLDAGRTVSESTLRWWLQQDDAARRALEGPAVLLTQALADLAALYTDGRCERIWANGQSFDISILDHAYAAGGQTSPWEFYNVRCFRTLKSLPSARGVSKPENALAHNALFDAIAQAQHLQALWAAGFCK